MLGLQPPSFRTLVATILTALAVRGAAAAASAPVEHEAALLEELHRRQAVCAPHDATARIDLAEWAITQGLDGPAESLLREAVDLDPANLGARRAIARLVGHRTPAHDSAALDDARRQLGPGFVEITTRRFVVLSDANMMWTRTQAERLERAAHQFGRFAARLDIEPLPLQHKLVCVLFADRDRYQAFARLHDEVRDDWIAGYYSPRHDRIVFYDGQSNPSVVRAREELATLGERVGEFDQAIRAARSARDTERVRQLVLERERIETHIRLESRRVDAFAGQVVTATTLHECVHQLLFHTRVQSPYVQYPVWICEGLATAFESDTPNRAFGPDREYAPRRDRFTELLAEGGLIPLRELVTMTELHESADVDALYHQSYAIVTWMNRFRRGELRRYLEVLREEPPGRIEPDRLLALFEIACGDVDDFERAWLRHERATTTAFVPGE